MYEILLEIDAPDGSEFAIKEHLAMYMERFGDVRVKKIRSTDIQTQSSFWNVGKHTDIPDLPLMPNPGQKKTRRR